MNAKLILFCVIIWQLTPFVYTLFGVNFILLNFACVKEMTNIRYGGTFSKNVQNCVFCARMLKHLLRNLFFLSWFGQLSSEYWKYCEWSSMNTFSSFTIIARFTRILVEPWFPFLASQDAQEVMLVSQWVSEWVTVSWLYWCYSGERGCRTQFFANVVF